MPNRSRKHAEPQPRGEHAVLRFPNDGAQVQGAIQSVMDALARHGFQKTATFAVRLALEEALANAFKHGHAGLPPSTPVTLEYDVSDGGATLSVEDQGPGFQPEDVPDPTLDENLSKPSGRGLLLMRAYMARVSHNPKGNKVTFEFRPGAGDED